MSSLDEGVVAMRARLIEEVGNLFYKLGPYDPLAFGSACVILKVVALAACFLPAWRGTRIDPVQALRS